VGDGFTGTAPIYHQIVQKICSQIVRGDLLPGDKLPSVRELAVQFGVNPNTVQRVYMELERLGIAEARRGQGTFVTEDQALLKVIRNQLKQDKIETFVLEMQELGFAPDEIIQGLRDYLDKLNKNGGASHE
jgi:GntR family transcriptional regulator